MACKRFGSSILLASTRKACSEALYGRGGELIEGLGDISFWKMDVDFSGRSEDLSRMFPGL
jgi:hypothetical protein